MRLAEALLECKNLDDRIETLRRRLLEDVKVQETLANPQFDDSDDSGIESEEGKENPPFEKNYANDY